MADYRVRVGVTKWIQYSVRAVSGMHAIQKVRDQKGDFLGEVWEEGLKRDYQYEAISWKELDDGELPQK